MLDASEHDEAPVTLTRESNFRIDPEGRLSGHKTLSWMHMVQVRRDARRKRADYALLENTRGEIADTDAANIFFNFGKDVITPPIDAGALPGVMRARVIDRLRKAGYDIAERPILLEEAVLATEVFISNALIGVSPVWKIDHYALPEHRSIARYLRGVLGFARDFG
jgi:branched-subunit amino acid aminotransferase/4-amino-4-deoxychorismate lyase